MLIIATVAAFFVIWGWRFWRAYPAYLQALRDRDRLTRLQIDTLRAQCAETRAALAPYRLPSHQRQP